MHYFQGLLPGCPRPPSPAYQLTYQSLDPISKASPSKQRPMLQPDIQRATLTGLLSLEDIRLRSKRPTRNEETDSIKSQWGSRRASHSNHTKSKDGSILKGQSYSEKPISESLLRMTKGVTYKNADQLLYDEKFKNQLFTMLDPLNMERSVLKAWSDTRKPRYIIGLWVTRDMNHPDSVEDLKN